MRIAVAGSGRLGTSVLAPLLESDHEIVALVGDGRRTRGFRRRLDPFVAGLFAGQHNFLGLGIRRGIPMVWIDKMTPEELAPLAKTQPDILLVSGFAIILKPPILELPRIGCVNMHSSLLPRHRGPNPFHAVLRANEEESGVSFHVMETGIDTGDILDQTPFPIEPEDAMYDAYNRACETAAERVVEVMDRIAAEGLVGTPQDPALASYDPKPTEDDSWIDWNDSAEAIDRLVRSMAPSPMPRFLFDGKTITVARTDFDPTPVEEAPGTVLKNRPVLKVATGLGTIVLRVAFVRRPLPWIFPAPWARPAVGDILGGRD